MPEEPWTPVKLINWTADYFSKHHVDEPRLDAELLLAHILGVDRIALYAGFERVLAPDELARFKALVKERVSGRPAKYITGRTEFFSVGLAVDERVLIPRPETELLVELSLAMLRGRPAGEFPLVVDLCTGSGAIAIALAQGFPDANYIATDKSPAALEVAAANAAANNVADKIEFLSGDFFEPLVTAALEERVDLVISNPPYVSKPDWLDLPREIRDFEPETALVAGPDGTEIQKRIIEAARGFLRRGAKLLMEMDDSQHDALAEHAARFDDYSSPFFHKDYARFNRVIELEKL